MRVLGIDIGGTSFRIGLVDENRTAVKFEKTPVKSVFHSVQPIQDLITKIEQFSKETPFDAIAVGFPATMNAERSRVVQAPNIPFMENLPVHQKLEQKFSVPVFIERDVTYALCYDMNKYGISDEGITCGIYFGTGIGNAISIGGVPLIGRHGTAGELGHIPVARCDIPCGCGNKGCLETVAGGKRLAQIQRECYPDTPIEKMFTMHGEDAVIQEFVDLMAIAVATEVNILDPDCVLLGGGVLNMTGFPKRVFTERVKEKIRKPLPASELKLVYADDERDKSVVGGAIYAHMKRNSGRDSNVEAV